MDEDGADEESDDREGVLNCQSQAISVALNMLSALAHSSSSSSAAVPSNDEDDDEEEAEGAGEVLSGERVAAYSEAVHDFLRAQSGDGEEEDGGGGEESDEASAAASDTTTTTTAITTARGGGGGRGRGGRGVVDDEP